jgi:hypothetical protein
MKDSTIIRIKVPAALYESVKKQLSIKEGKNDFGMPGSTTIKEKKSKDSAPKKKTESKKAEKKAPEKKVKKANAPVKVTPDNEVKADKDVPGMGLTEKKKFKLSELKKMYEILGEKIAKMQEKKETPKKATEI